MFLPTDFVFDKAFKKAFPVRHDGTPYLRYPAAKSHGVNEEDFSFMSGEYRLYGSRVFVDKKNVKGLVVFCHGATAGRSAYGHLIASIAKQGYLVYAFDYTGCMQSGGVDCNGMGQPLIDLDYFFDFLDKQEDAKGLKRIAVGHSWGGFIATACLQSKYNVDRIINISGFSSVEDVACSKSGNSPIVRFLVRGYLRRKYGKIGLFSGLDMMKKTDKEVLVIFGEDDRTVDVDYFFHRYQKEVNNPHVHFLEIKDRGHQPYWSSKAQRYYNEVVRGGVLFKDGIDPDEKIDYGILFDSEPVVMNAIYDFLCF